MPPRGHRRAREWLRLLLALRACLPCSAAAEVLPYDRVSCGGDARDATCFTEAYSCMFCCGTRLAGPNGWTRCWNGDYTYARCCPACPRDHDPSCFEEGSGLTCAACCDRRRGEHGDEACWSAAGAAAPRSFARCCLGRAPICSPSQHGTPGSALGKAARWALQTSQFGQDRFALEWLKCPSKGFYVDIGAYDGEHLSNTHAMDLDLGWRGLCVDAVLRQGRFVGRSCRLMQGVVYNTTGRRMRFQTFPEHHESAYGQLAARSQSAKGSDKVLGQWNAVPVRTVTAADLLRQAAAEGVNVPRVIDFFSAVLQVLQGFPFSQYCVRVWALEIWDPLNDEKTRESYLQIVALLQAYSYFLAQRLDQDYLFVHRHDCRGW